MCNVKERIKNTGLSNSTIRSKSRKQEICIKRNYCMMCLRKKNKTLNWIGKKFNRSHSTVIHSLQMIDILIKIKDPYTIKILQSHKCFIVK